jgi:hypothetical protein
MAADSGLIHSVSNCEGHINCICNCCVHACGIMKSMSLGLRNAGGVSRYQMHYSGKDCDQCGICGGLSNECLGAQRGPAPRRTALHRLWFVRL